MRHDGRNRPTTPGVRVSLVTCGEPLSLSHIPTDRVVRIEGPSAEQLAVSLDPLPDGAPVVIRYRLPDSPASLVEVVDDVLNRLEAIARALFPAWLPEAEVVTTSSDFDVRVVRGLARRKASITDHFGPFLADVAEAALYGRVTTRPCEPELRARGLARIIGDAYQRRGVVLLIEADEGLSDDAERRAAMACEWLAGHGFGVWLSDGALPAADRFSTWSVTVPAFVEQLAPTRGRPTPALEYPAVAGRPHPASTAEQTLERWLARCDWALGRVWNQVHASHSLTPPIRVDLMWVDDRVVVEIDGPDHRGVLKYADDRRRDNGLVLDGFAVLRFTNDEIADDPQRVVGTIERLLVKLRADEGTLP
jgi:very-short-patch-repair endonuclease